MKSKFGVWVFIFLTMTSSAWADLPIPKDGPDAYFSGIKNVGIWVSSPLDINVSQENKLPSDYIETLTASIENKAKIEAGNKVIVLKQMEFQRAPAVKARPNTLIIHTLISKTVEEDATEKRYVAAIQTVLYRTSNDENKEIGYHQRLPQTAYPQIVIANTKEEFIKKIEESLDQTLRTIIKTIH